jgi:hypothetical protein
MPQARVDSRVILDTSAGFAGVRGLHETNQTRDLNLMIEEDGDHFRLMVMTSNREVRAAFGDLLGRQPIIPITKEELAGAIQKCREVWRRAVVDHKVDGQDIFQDGWDLSDRPDILQSVLPQIADAGAKLFLTVFFPRRLGGGADDETLRSVGLVLRELMQRPLVLKITSDSFFAPWTLMYSRPNTEPATAEGFWGYQHLIEHVPASSGSMGQELRQESPLGLGLQFDKDIDIDLNVRCLAPVLELIDSYDASVLTRKDRVLRADLERALKSREVKEQILYFCCHAQQEGDFAAMRFDENFIILSDRPQDLKDNRITPDDIRLWIDVNVLEGNPVVFLNACGGGQMNSLFYEAFGKTFLGLGASAVIGPQVEVPAALAGEFARRFFEEFFRGSSDRQLGRILFDLRRQLFDQHANPLGMIYSVYRGADVYLKEGVTV